NLTWCPFAAHIAPTPPARSSQSSGWAPKQMTRNLPSSGGAALAGGFGAACDASAGAALCDASGLATARPATSPHPKQTTATRRTCVRLTRHLPSRWVRSGAPDTVTEGAAARHRQAGGGRGAFFGVRRSPPLWPFCSSARRAAREWGRKKAPKQRRPPHSNSRRKVMRLLVTGASGQLGGYLLHEAAVAA